MSARDRVKAWASSLIEDIDDTHPEAVSRLDRADGAGTRRPSDHDHDHDKNEGLS